MVISRRREALKQVAELAKIERQATASMGATMQRLLILAIKHQQDFRVRSDEVRALHVQLRDAQVSAHLIGARRARLSVAQALRSPRLSRKAIRASVLENTLRLFKTLTEDELAALTATYEASTAHVLANLTTAIGQGVRDALEEAVRSNVTPTAAIRAFFSKQGLTASNSYYFETLLRTQTQLVYSAARQAEYADPDLDEIIWGYEYITVGDDRVRENHVALDGVIAPKNSPIWMTIWTPNGYNCRCQVIPVFEPTKIRLPGLFGVPDKGFEFNPAQLLQAI